MLILLCILAKWGPCLLSSYFVTYSINYTCVNRLPYISLWLYLKKQDILPLYSVTCSVGLHKQELQYTPTLMYTFLGESFSYSTHTKGRKRKSTECNWIQVFCPLSKIQLTSKNSSLRHVKLWEQFYCNEVIHEGTVF